MIWKYWILLYGVSWYVQVLLVTVLPSGRTRSFETVSCSAQSDNEILIGGDIMLSREDVYYEHKCGRFVSVISTTKKKEANRPDLTGLRIYRLEKSMHHMSRSILFKIFWWYSTSGQQWFALQLQELEFIFPRRPICLVPSTSWEW